MNAEAFWARVDTSGDCWPWTGPTDGRGYGALRWQGKVDKAHRVAWALTHGDPTGWILHHCDNRLCVRPDHLFEGTHADNMADMKQKGRGAGRLTYRPVTHCPRGHSYAVYGRSYKGKRYCRECQRQRWHERLAQAVTRLKEVGG